MSAIADAKARTRAIDPQRSFIVQAPAGSGKTELLIQRFLRLLATVERPEEILAITFTRKAAGEMRGRLLLALQAARDPAPQSDHGRLTWQLATDVLERDARLGWHLLDNPSLLYIQTIDSFNASLVRRMPWISRFGAMPEISGDPMSLYREAARRVLQRLDEEGTGSAEVARVLTHLDNRMDLLQDMLVGMLARRDQWLRHLGQIDHEGWRALLERSLADFIEGQLKDVAGLIPVSLQSEVLTLGRYAAGNLPDSDRPLSRLDGLSRWPGACAADLPIWLGLADLLLTAGNTFRKSLDKNSGFPTGKGEPAAMKEQMKELLDRLKGVAGLETALAALRQLPDACYPDSQWQVLRALVELLPLAAAELWLVFRQEAKTDFAAVATRALSALGSVDDPSELLLQLDARIRHILVDEFQDTSYLQYHLLQQLTAGWQPDDGRTLFVVGDPMQSIYLFREAEVGLFLRARSRGLGTVELERLDLCSNFRSQQGIVAWVNDTFAQLFPAVEDEALGGVVYAESAAVHPPLLQPACVVHPFAERDDVAEAERVADLAQQALAAHPEQTVAVLVRARTHLPEILRAFAGRNLRFTAKDIDLLECRPAVRDLLALTRALAHPADRLSWLCVLRAPWCGLLLSDLEALCGGDKVRTIPELLDDAGVMQTLSEDGRQRAVRIRSVMQLGRQRRGAISLRRLVEGVWLALGGAACYDDAALKDAGMVFTLMEQCDKGGDLESFDALDEGVRKLFASPDTGADGRLQVMTIHKSKGLEFDTVILPGLGRGPAGSDRHLLRWLEHPDCGLLLAPVAPRDGRSKDTIYEAIGRLEAEKSNLETVRLLYVAATRAKESLHLLGHAKIGKNGDPNPLSGSLLHKLWPVVSDQFVFPTTEADAGELPSVERVPVTIRRLPVDWQLPSFASVALPVASQASQPSKHPELDQRQELFSGWEAETARHVGTLAHHFLERMACEGLDRWSPERVEGERAKALRRLNRLGVPSDEVEAGWTKVASALKSTLASQRGTWILGAREQGVCEMELSGLVDGSLVHAVIDRTFIDSGVRWIVDYKVVEMTGTSKQAFLEGQLKKYQNQLQAYMALLGQLEPEREVRAALYFPLSDSWVEVEAA